MKVLLHANTLNVWGKIQQSLIWHTAALRSLAASGAILLSLWPAYAQLVVNNTSDAPRVANRLPVCDIDPSTPGDQCSLRAAIQTANISSDVTNITFRIPTTDPGYNAQTGSYTINLGSALPDLSTDVNITGPGADKLIVNRSDVPITPSFRIFNVTTTGAVSFSGLTISRGLAPAAEAGGGIQNASGGTINVVNCTLRYNAAPTDGGAISNTKGVINVTNSKLEFNGANYDGGAIVVYDQVNVSDSAFLHNSSGRGGAIAVHYSATITGSTFSENTSPLGGAIYSETTAIITNSTFYANSAGGADGLGGAIFNDILSLLHLSNCTVTANFSGGGGSGVYNAAPPADENGFVDVKSTIIAGNYGGTFVGGASPDVYGAFVSQGFNLIGKKDGSTGFTAATDKKGTIATPLNPGLDWKGLRENGGPTQTVALQPGSQAIDKGTSASLAGPLTSDQRGLPRTVDKTAVNATGGDGTDIGAFELQ